MAPARHLGAEHTRSYAAIWTLLDVCPTAACRRVVLSQTAGGRRKSRCLALAMNLLSAGWLA